MNKVRIESAGRPVDLMTTSLTLVPVAAPVMMSTMVPVPSRLVFAVETEPVPIRGVDVKFGVAAMMRL